MNIGDALEAQCDRRKFQRFKAFASLIKTPQSWLTPVQLPAAAKVFVKLGAPTAANTAVFTVGSKTYYAKSGLAAGVAYPVGFLENKETLTAVYNASTIQLYIQHPLGKLYLIASK